MPKREKYDYEDGNLFVHIHDSGVPSPARYVASIELWLEGNDHPTFQYYEYGLTPQEALEEAKRWIAEYRAEIR